MGIVDCRVPLREWGGGGGMLVGKPASWSLPCCWATGTEMGRGP